jgi:hypothetical protein
VRIRVSRDSERHSFWSDTTRWIQSHRGREQFFLAVAVGFLISASLVVVYRTGGWKVVDPLILSIFVEAEETTDIFLETNDLPTLYFDIGFEEYRAMAAQREEALQTGILLQDDEDWMPAEIRFQGETLPVRIRLKGDWSDHLKENKWSFRVKTRGDAALMGMRSFSVQSPATRLFLKEWLYLEDLRRADILAPRYSFVNVTVNGDDWGIYALEESFSKELLESQGRREGVIVRFDENLFWQRRAGLGGKFKQWEFSADPIAGSFESLAFAQVDEFNTTKVQNDPVLREQSLTALGLLRGFQAHQLPTSEVFDSKLVGKYIAHSNLWATQHGLTWHNERYYYNPLTARLEPIGYDSLPFNHLYVGLIDLSQYEDLEIMAAYAQEVERISQPEYLEQLRTEYAAQYEDYYAALAQEFPEDQLEIPWDILADRQFVLRKTLQPPQTVYAYQVGGDTDPTIDLLVGNVLRYAVVLQHVRIGDRAIAIRPEWIAEDSRRLFHQEANPAVVLRRAWSTPQYAKLHVPTAYVEQILPEGTAFYSNTLQLITSVYGTNDPIVVDVRPSYPPILTASALPTRPTVEEALAKHPFLTPSDQPGFLELKPGDWRVDGDLVLPQGFGLWATQPVTLTFDREAVFFSSEPLLLRGSDEQNIYLGPKEDYWGGLIVLNAGTDLASTLHNVEIRGTAGISRDGWMTTGGVTFYESPVVLSNCRLLDSVAEDTINVVRSQFAFTHCEFGNAISDAFDGDFVEGRIEQCAFHDVRGDGIDVSGSTITVQDVNLLRIYDKGISAGEGSTVNASSIRADQVGIAIASKDTSQVTAEGVFIRQAWIVGLAAFCKKMEYGPASIEASYVIFEDASHRTLVQTDSRVTRDGRAASTAEIDVDQLYGLLEELAAMHLLSYRFDDDIRLIGYNVMTPSLNPGDELRLALYWRTEDKPERDYTVFVHILNSDGELVAQHDSMPQNDAWPTTQWLAGSLVGDTHVVPLPADLPPGTYHVQVGLYTWQTGERLPMYRPDGEELPGSALTLDQTLEVVR